MIRARGLSRRYGDHWALRDIDLDLEGGEWLAIVGPNGSGKTTLARAICGLTKSDNGELDITGRVAAVFEDADSQIIGDTVFEDVALGPENLCLPPEEIKARVEWALTQTGLTHLRNRWTATLSGGEKKRLVIAGALAMQPQFLILDEPSSMLDPQSHRTLIRTITSLHRDGMGILWITHDLGEALLADRAIILQDGRKQWEGPADHLPHVDGINDLVAIPPHINLALQLEAMGHPLSTDIDELARTLEGYPRP